MIPRRVLEDFTREHPIFALAIVVYGACMVGFALALALTKP